MIKKFSIIMFFIFILFIISSCEEYTTEITMKPESGKLIRGVKVFSWVEDYDPNGMSTTYSFWGSRYSGTKKLILNNESTVYGNFTNRMNGAGSFNSFQTSLGTAYFYSENFLGTRDFVQELEKFNKTIDIGIYFLNKWLQQTLGNTPQYDQLQKFLNTGFKKDVKNVFFIMWNYYNQKLNVSGDDEKFDMIIGTEESFAQVITQYAIEKEYILPEKDYPLLFKTAEGCSSSVIMEGAIMESSGTQLLARENLKRRFDYSQEQIDPVFDPNGLESCIESDPLFLQFQEEQRFQRQDPNYVATVEDFLYSLIGIDLIFPATDQIKIEFSTGAEPFNTNGVWDTNSGIISWSTETIERDNVPKLPRIAYANWVNPDIKFQEEHFGKVLINGLDLGEYCLWYAALEQKDRIEWDEFLINLELPCDPNENADSQIVSLKKAINDFKFSEIKEANLDIIEKRQAYRKKGKDIILENISR